MLLQVYLEKKLFQNNDTSTSSTGIVVTFLNLYCGGMIEEKSRNSQLNQIERPEAIPFSL